MGKPTKAISDSVTGTSGSDLITFIGGHATLNGVDHSIPAGATHLTLSGGGGNDTIVSDSPYGSASLALSFDGGTGTDTLDLSNVGEAVWVRLAAATRPGGSQPVIATQFTVEYLNVSGGDPNDPNALVTSATDPHNNITNIESVIGTAYNDYLELGNYSGTADGGAGNDRVVGGIGNDQLFGGAGDDFLFGKGGDDVLTGGAGADQFEVITFNGNDVITDFNAAEGDTLHIGWQNSTDVIPDGNSWQSSSWTDSHGLVHQAITASFTGGSITLVDLTLADVPILMDHTSDFHFLNG